MIKDTNAFEMMNYTQAKVHLLYFSLISRGNRSEVTIAFVGNMGGRIPSWIDSQYRSKKLAGQLFKIFKYILEE